MTAVARFSLHMPILLSLVLMLPLARPAETLAARPDQVLVVYNRDWTGDAPGTAPGQDSEEVARYYATCHADAKTGRKPFLLGLSCKHRGQDGKPLHHLNGEALGEASRDNAMGVVYKGLGKPLDPKGKQRLYLLSNLIECILPAERFNADGMTLKIGPSEKEQEATAVFSNGTSSKVDAVTVSVAPNRPGRLYQTSGSQLGLAGEFHLWITIKDKGGQTLVDRMMTYPDYARIGLGIESAKLDWGTLEAFVYSPRSPQRRFTICRGGKSLIGPNLRVEPPAGGRPGRLTLNAQAVGWRGDFVLGWAGKDAAGQQAGSGQQFVLDGRRVHLNIPETARGVDWDSLALRYSQSPEPASAKPLVENGVCKVQSELVSETPHAGGGKVLRLSALRMGLRGDVYAFLNVQDKKGQAVDLTARYFDGDDFIFTRTGADGIRDDQHYLDDVEEQIKAFLQDPANAVEGKSLKDHILYIVFSYGLPRTVTRVYGLSQTARPLQGTHDAGPLVSLEQRAEMMYYDIEKVRPPALVPFAFRNDGGGFSPIIPTSSYILPFQGWRDQPFLHPEAYQGSREAVLLKRGQDAPRLTSDLRSQAGDRFLYVCSRLGGPTPHEAKALVDRSLYASRHLTAAMGAPPPAGAWDGAKALQQASTAKTPREFIEKLSLPGLNGMMGPYKTSFGWREGGGYLPGAVDWTVISNNGFNNERAAIHQMLANGVTATGAAARSESGCAHTTTHGWWDEGVFYRLLFGGYDLGEAWLYSKFKCQWVTCYIGDPLYHPDLAKTVYDTAVPRVARAEDLAVRIERDKGKARAVVSARLACTPEEPEVAVASVEYWEKGQPATVLKAGGATYAAQPEVVLGNLKAGTEYQCRLILTDPYDNKLDTSKALGLLTVNVPR
ncbi:MAG: hypothetical protein BWX88_02404 [Planctomycetes bacterium ADurb.Bin126]|nr:MAG: hypothetical protein BWX88_02404 [Planctomycetes bacterium ADurb.Bin126]HQL75479.1 hypothetical protein [Phycisphaerae bacterium]